MILTRAALDRPHTVLALTLAVAVLGLFAFWRTPTDLFPDTVPPQAIVLTTWPGASAADVQDEVTRLLERELGSLPGLVRLTSTSRDGVSAINAEFLFEKRAGEAVLDVQNAVSRVEGALPSGARAPMIHRVTDATRPILTLAVAPGRESRGSLVEIRLLAENDLRDALLALPEVADVHVFGGAEPEIVIRADQAALVSRGLGLAEVAAAVAAQNRSAPAGLLTSGNGEFQVRLAGAAGDLAELARLPLTPAGRVLLGDVARLELAEADPRSLFHGNGRQGVALNVLRAEGGDTTAAIDAVKQALPGLERRWPDLAFAVVDDQEPLIRRNVDGMRGSLWQAVLFTVLAIFLFLGSPRASAVAAAAIPLSFLAALAVLWSSPYTLNMVTMSGLIIATGMVVDASVVVLENIHGRRREGAGARAAALEGTGQVALAITAGMLTTVIVLLPVMHTGGYTGRVMRPLVLMIVSTLAASLLVSLTIVPILAARLLRPGREGPVERLARPIAAALEAPGRLYAAVVRRALKMRFLVLLLLALFLAATLRIVRPLLGGEQMPPMDTGIALVEFDCASGAAPAEIEEALDRVEAVILATPGVRMLSSTAGSEPGAISFGGGGATLQTARISVHLPDRTERAETIWEIQEGWRESLRRIPQVRTFRISEFGATPVSTTRAPLDVLLSGPDPARLDLLADQALARLRGLPGLTDLRRSWHRDRPELTVIPRPDLARLHGSSTTAAAAQVQAALQGIQAGVFGLEGFLDIPVRVRLEERQVDSRERLEELYLDTTPAPLPLRALAEVRHVLGYPFLTREQHQATISLTAGVLVRTSAEAAAEAAARLADLPLPPGYTLEIKGTAADMAESQRELGAALALGIVLLYLLLLALFRSFLHPLTIMAAIPLAAAGALWGLLAFDKPICMPALMGLILLGGTIVNNSILLLDFILAARKEGVAGDEAIVQAVLRRSRPILMTAFSTIVGLTPLILESAVGLERMSPLGIAAAAGLLFGTLVTMVAVPVLFSALESVQGLARRMRR